MILNKRKWVKQAVYLIILSNMSIFTLIEAPIRLFIDPFFTNSNKKGGWSRKGGYKKNTAMPFAWWNRKKSKNDNYNFENLQRNMSNAKKARESFSWLKTGYKKKNNSFNMFS